MSEGATTTVRSPNKPPILRPTDAGFYPTLNGRNGWNLSDIYELGEVLGGGAFRTVHMGTHQFAQQEGEDGDTDTADWKHVAIKRTKPNLLDLRDACGEITEYGRLEQCCQEVKALLKLKEGSPTICPVVYLYEIFMSGRDVYMVTGKLEQQLHEWRGQVELFTENMAIDICKTVLTAIDFMHSRNVVHRALTLQNMMFRKRGDFRSLKIIDFGLARVLEPAETTSDVCGTIGFIAPETYLGEPYRFEVDMFSFGVTLFRLLSGERPFEVGSSRQYEQILKRRTIECSYNFNSENWLNVSSAAKDLIRKLLINREERLTAADALGHQWFREG